MKKLVLVLLSLALVAGCAGQNIKSTPMAPQEVIVKIQAADPATHVTVKEDKERVNKSMEIPNPRGRLSQLSFISKDKGFVKIFSGLSVADVTRLWNDITFLEYETNIRDIHLFINSTGLTSEQHKSFLLVKYKIGQDNFMTKSLDAYQVFEMPVFGNC